MEKKIATHSSILAWRIIWTEEPGGLLSMGSHRVGHDWSDLACMHALEREMATHSSILAWRIPGQRSLVGCHLWGRRTWLKRLSSSSGSMIEVSLTGEKYTPNTGFKPIILLYLPCQLGFLLKTFGYASIVIEFCSLLLREREGQDACACVVSQVWLFVIPWTVVCQSYQVSKRN